MGCVQSTVDSRAGDYAAKRSVRVAPEQTPVSRSSPTPPPDPAPSVDDDDDDDAPPIRPLLRVRTLAAHQERRLSMRASLSLAEEQNNAVVTGDRPYNAFITRKKQYSRPISVVNGVAQELVDDLVAGRCVVFLGAGWDIPAGMPSWVQLLNLIIDDGHPLTVDQQTDFRQVLQQRS